MHIQRFQLDVHYVEFTAINHYHALSFCRPVLRASYDLHVIGAYKL